MQSRINDKITDILRQFQPQSDLYVIPLIPKEKEEHAREALSVPVDEQVLGLVDCTVFGSARDALVFCTGGIYFRGLGGAEKNSFS